MTSAHATIHHIQQTLPEAKRLFVVTTESALEDWRLGGFEIVEEDPDVVVVSFDFNLNYDRLCRTAYLLQPRRAVPGDPPR